MPVAPALFRVEQFPADWLGTWQGEVMITRPGEVALPLVQMTRIFEPTEDPVVFRWTTIYSGSQGEQTREYLLRVVDGERGQYAIDEQNGIVLSSQFVGDTLYSWSASGWRVVRMVNRCGRLRS